MIWDIGGVVKEVVIRMRGYRIRLKIGYMIMGGKKAG